MDIKVSLDTTGVTRMTRIMAQDQLPHSMALAIREVGLSSQAAQHVHIGRKFKVRRPSFTLRSVKVKEWPNKRKPGMTLAIEPPGGPSRADILSKFEEGGTKRPRGTRLAIPQKGGVLRPEARVIPRNLRPKGLNFKHHGGAVHTGDKRTFMIRNPDGSGGIFQRVGKGAARSSVKTGRQLGGTRLLYSFARTAKIDDRLQFESNVQETVQREWPAAFGRAFEKAMRTAR